MINVAYTPEEEDLLRVLYPKMPPEVTAMALGRSVGALYSKSFKMGIKAFRGHGGKEKKIGVKPFAFSTGCVEAAYWAGFIAADGSLSEDRCWLAVWLANQDREHVKKLARFLGFEGELYENRKTGSQDQTGLVVCGSPFIYLDLMYRFGITPRKSTTIQPPEGLSHEHEVAFCRGLFDGDGSAGVYEGFGRISQVVGTIGLATWFAGVLGVRLTKPQPAGKSWQIQYVSANARKVARTLLEPCVPGLPRKTEKLLEIVVS